MKRGLSLAIFIVIGIIAWWSITSENDDQDTGIQGKGGKIIELFMNDFETTRLDDAGQPFYTVKGKRLERYKDSDRSIIRSPQFHLRRENEWLVQAEKAVIDHDLNVITLMKDVVMQQLHTDDAITMRTSKMKINMKTGVASSRQAVNMLQGDSVIDAIGMVYNHNTGDMELKSQVRGLVQ